MFTEQTETMFESTSGLQNKIWHYCVCDRVALRLYREAGFPQEWATVINVEGRTVRAALTAQQAEVTTSVQLCKQKIQLGVDRIQFDVVR